MRAKLDLFYDGEVKTYPFSDPRDGIWIALKATAPKSSIGRAIDLFLSEADRDKLLLLLKEEAIRARK